MGTTSNSVDDSFVKPTAMLLNDVGSGCFVQKLEPDGSRYWLEITSVGDTGYEGIAHPALVNDCDASAVTEGDHCTVERDQITALGCGRFCFC